MLGNRFTRLFMWMGLAAAATYFFDPERGEKRRKDLRKQVNQMRKKGEDMSKKAAKLAD
jgi:gas vesicle protein